MKFAYFLILAFSRLGRCLSIGEDHYETNYTIWDTVVLLPDVNQENIEEELSEILCTEQWLRFIKA